MKIARLIVIMGVISLLFPCELCLSKSIKPGTNFVCDKPGIINVLNSVAKWQIDNFTYELSGTPGRLHDYGIDSWTNSIFYLGLYEWAAASGNESYFKWLIDKFDENKWKVPGNFVDRSYSLYHADELCITQVYLKMYDRYRKAEMINGASERINWIISNPPSDSMNYRIKQSWTWCDALFMAPAAYAQMANITRQANCLEFMDVQFRKTYDHLYDKKEHLFFRDDSYFEKREANGEKIFWGRGNGWVVAGVVNILKQLPSDYPARWFYISLLKEMTEKLASLQDENGFWHASLLDPGNYPSPETSSTSLITYAMAYAIEEKIISENKYMPVLEKAWGALCSSVEDSGKLCWVQPIGADPKKVNRDMTAVFGVGAFLLAGTQIYEMAGDL